MKASERSVGKGSPKPGPVPEGSVRLYSMRFCPYAQRPLLILLAKGIKHEVVNINLKRKPEWFLEKNIHGLVPVLELSTGDVIYESPIVCEYLDDAFAGKKLTPSDPLQKARQKIILEFFSGITSLLLRLLKARKSNQDITEMKAEARGEFQKLNEILVKNKTPYFGGESLSMIDYMIYPWFERSLLFDMTEILSQMPDLKKWNDLMLQDPAVKQTFVAPDVLAGFCKLYFQDSTEAADYGL